MEEAMRMTSLGLAVVLMAAGVPRAGAAAEIKVLTVGALTKRIEGGEGFDVAVLTPGAVNELAGKGKFVAGSRVNLGRVGVGVVVKEGTPKPDVSSVDAFKKALLAAKSVAYIDP